MAPKYRPDVIPLRKRGSAICVTISRRILHELGWNESDIVHVTTARGSLLVTKVTLPVTNAATELHQVG